MTEAAPIGIIAAAGDLPRRVADALERAGRPVTVIVLKSVADADFSGFDHREIRLGALGEIIAVLKAKGCVEVALTGKLVRPTIAAALPDARASKVILKLLSAGDNAALEMIAEMFAEEGMTIIDAGSILDHQQAGEGRLAGPPADDASLESIAAGQAVLDAISIHDVGQSVLVQGRRVLAIEAAEGTDAMIARSAALIDPDLGPTVLIKMMKKDQHRHLDPPVIGSATIAQAAKAGISVVAVEAGGVILADPEATLARATADSISLIGIRRA